MRKIMTLLFILVAGVLMFSTAAFIQILVFPNLAAFRLLLYYASWILVYATIIIVLFRKH